MDKYAAEDIGQRTPSRGAAHYAGNHVKHFKKVIESGHPMGPNAMGEYMWPVEAEYLAEKQTTRVRFTLFPHPSVLGMGEVR
jgi:hypothetical protein